MRKPVKSFRLSCFLTLYEIKPVKTTLTKQPTLIFIVAKSLLNRKTLYMRLTSKMKTPYYKKVPCSQKEEKNGKKIALQLSVKR